MPYKQITQLPDSVKNNLPKGAQEIYKEAFNAARPDFIAAIAALFGVLIFDTLPGLVIGIAVSILLLLYRASSPNVAVLGRVPGASRHWGDIAPPGERAGAPGGGASCRERTLLRQRRLRPGGDQESR